MQQRADGSLDRVERMPWLRARIDAEPLQGHQAAVSTADPELQLGAAHLDTEQPTSAPAADIGLAQCALRR